MNDETIYHFDIVNGELVFYGTITADCIEPGGGIYKRPHELTDNDKFIVAKNASNCTDEDISFITGVDEYLVNAAMCYGLTPMEIYNIGNSQELFYFLHENYLDFKDYFID